MTREETAKLIAMLKAIWPNHPIHNAEALIAAYHLVWADIPYDAGLAAVTQYAASERYFPSPAEIRELAAQHLGVAPTPEEAWQEVVTQMREHGFYGRPAFSHPMIAAAVRDVGWRTLCGSEQPDATRRQFLSAYGARRQRLLREGNLGRLAQQMLADRLAALPREASRAAAD